jgi:hypothetical protein
VRTVSAVPPASTSLNPRRTHPGLSLSRADSRCGQPQTFRKSTGRTRMPSGSSPRRRQHLRVRINHPGEHHPKLITRAAVSGMISRSMNPSSRGKPHIPQPEKESWPNARSAGDSATSRAVLADAHPATIVQARQQRHQYGGIWRPERTTRDGLIEALTALGGRCRTLTTRIWRTK